MCDAGTLSDIWVPEQGGRVAVGYILAPFLGPSVGPLIGAYALAQYNYNWKWAVWVVLCILAPVGVAILFMEETSKQPILERRARKRGGSVRIRKFGEEIKKVGRQMLRPLHMCAVEVRLLALNEASPVTDLCVVPQPLSIFLGFYTSYSFAMVFSFFGSYAYVYTVVYRFDSKQIGLCYIAVVVGAYLRGGCNPSADTDILPGFLFAVVTFGIFDAIKYRPEVARTNGRVAPEHRLYSALVGCWLVPIGLFV